MRAASVFFLLRIQALGFQFVVLAADRHHPRVLSPHHRFTRHCDHWLLSGLLRLVLTRLIESGLRLLKTIGRISIGARDACQLYRVFRFIQFEWILLVYPDRHETRSFALAGIHASWQQLVFGIDCLDHALRIGAHDVLHHHHVARLRNAVIRFCRDNQAEGLNVTGRFDAAVGSFAVITQR